MASSQWQAISLKIDRSIYIYIYIWCIVGCVGDSHLTRKGCGKQLTVCVMASWSCSRLVNSTPWRHLSILVTTICITHQTKQEFDKDASLTSADRLYDHEWINRFSLCARPNQTLCSKFPSKISGSMKHNSYCFRSSSGWFWKLQAAGARPVFNFAVWRVHPFIPCKYINGIIWIWRQSLICCGSTRWT